MASAQETTLPHQRNLVLATLPEDELEALKPHLKPDELKHGDIIAHPHQRIERVHFPTAGIISLVVGLSDGGMIETGMVGRDGVFGAGPALDSKLQLSTAIVQVGGEGYVADVEAVRALAETNRTLRSALIRHEQVALAQAQQSAGCNASHSVEARMCRWLLRMHDLVGEELPLTQEFLGQMMGVRRTSVSLVANTLQQAGLISYRRGRVRIVNVEGIRESACECYEAVRAHYEALYRI
jgi:CRP-like cAMP-binding protein